ncbi:MAG: DUF4412 domain-containing protein [Planctomycetes bacterium]|nr:DUF4412 domain-containing protein [Planctomycetota bacterium]
MKLLHAALLTFVLAAPAAADVLLTKSVHTDEFTTPNGVQPAKTESQLVWLAKDKVRAEMGPVTYVVRLDQRKLFLLRPAEKTFSAIDLPVNLAAHVPKSDETKFEQMKSRLALSALVTPTEETERVKGWAAKKYKVQTSILDTPSDETIWTTKDIEVDWTSFWDAQAALRSLQPGSETLILEMRKLDGIVVKADRTRTTAAGKLHSLEELVSAERKEAPEGTYEVPKDYTEKPFDPIAELRRMVGARPGAGPGDTPAPGEKPADEKRGERRRGEKDANGGGEKRGGEPKRGGDAKQGG